MTAVVPDVDPPFLLLDVAVLPRQASTYCAA
jgi:hypothetical protein